MCRERKGEDKKGKGGGEEKISKNGGCPNAASYKGKFFCNQK